MEAVKAIQSAPGTFLANDIVQGHLSNVKQSFYLFDEGNCSTKPLRNMITNFQIENLVNSKIYGTVILVSMRNFEKDLQFTNEDNQVKFSPIVLNQNIVEIKNIPIKAKLPNNITVDKKERVNVHRVDNLVLINAQPMVLGITKNNAYGFLKGAMNPAQALMSLLETIVSQLQLNQVSVVVDSLEYLQMLCKPADTLKFIQQVTFHQVFYPFYCHVDFGLVQDKKFQQLVLKAQNGLFKFEKDTTKNQNKYGLIYSSVVKPGNRFVDELSIIGGLNPKNKLAGGVKLIGNKGPALEYFDETKQVDTVQQKQQAVKASFKIENNDQERAIKEQVNTTLYHTGSKTIKLDEQDMKEVEQSQLESVAESALRESSDEGDGDDEQGDDDDDYDDEDPDDDLNF